jgi:hypothetical protein
MSQTLQRAINILEMVADEPRRIGDIAAALGVHHSTALRLVHTLRANNLLLQQPDHSYRLGSAVFALANRALEQIELRDVAKPYMRELGDATAETVHLGILESDAVVYVDKVEARQTVRMYSRIGAIATARFDADRMRAALKEGFVDATELADYLAAKGLPFRDAHHVVGRLVKRAYDERKTLSELTLEQLREAHAAFDADVYAALDPETAIERRQVPGSPARAMVQAQLKDLRERLATRQIDFDRLRSRFGIAAV